MILARQLMFRLAEGVTGEESLHGHFVVPALTDGTPQGPGNEQTQHSPETRRHDGTHFRQDHPLTEFSSAPSQDGPQQMHQHQQENPPHF